MSLATIMVMVVLAAEPAKTQDAIRVECHGQLRTGIVAIGGETTGTTLTFDRVTWELQLPDDASREFARDHHKKPVTVVGSLRQVSGTQIPIRWIVDVTRISPREDHQKYGATVTMTGLLQADGKDDVPSQIAVDGSKTKFPVDLSKDVSLQTLGKRLKGKRVLMTGHAQRQGEGPGSARLVIRVDTIKTDD